MSVRVNARATSTFAMFGVLVMGTLVCWWHWLVMLLRYALTNEQYSHVLLVLPIGISLAILEGRAKHIKPNWSPFPSLALVVAALTVLFITQVSLLMTSETALEIGIGSLVVFWIGTVMLFLGIGAVRQLWFSFLFLFSLIPIPEFLVAKAITVLRIASAEGTYSLFRWFGVPVLKSGFYLALPSLDIEIAEQCSGIRSSLVLVISSLVLGHLFLRSCWGKILVVLLAIPVTIAKNAVRIFVLSMLGIRWNPAFLYGNLHRNGGIVFFALALAGMALLLKLIGQVEKWIDRPSIPQPVTHHLSTWQS